MAENPLDALLPGGRCDDVTARYFGRELGRGVVLRRVPTSALPEEWSVLGHHDGDTVVRSPCANPLPTLLQWFTSLTPDQQRVVLGAIALSPDLWRPVRVRSGRNGTLGLYADEVCGAGTCCYARGHAGGHGSFDGPPNDPNDMPLHPVWSIRAVTTAQSLLRWVALGRPTLIPDVLVLSTSVFLDEIDDDTVAAIRAALAPPPAGQIDLDGPCTCPSCGGVMNEYTAPPGWVRRSAQVLGEWGRTTRLVRTGRHHPANPGSRLMITLRQSDGRFALLWRTDGGPEKAVELLDAFDSEQAALEAAELVPTVLAAGADPGPWWTYECRNGCSCIDSKERLTPRTATRTRAARPRVAACGDAMSRILAVPSAAHREALLRETEGGGRPPVLYRCRLASGRWSDWVTAAVVLPPEPDAEHALILHAADPESGKMGLDRLAWVAAVRRGVSLTWGAPVWRVSREHGYWFVRLDWGQYEDDVPEWSSDTVPALAAATCAEHAAALVCIHLGLVDRAETA